MQATITGVDVINQTILTYRGNITVHLTYCSTCLDSAALLMLSNNRFNFLVKSNLHKQVSLTVILAI